MDHLSFPSSYRPAPTAQDFMLGAQAPAGYKPGGSQSMASFGQDAALDPGDFPVADQPGFLDGIGGLKGLGSIASGIGDLGKLFAALKGLGLAKDQLNFSKESYKTNLANQTKTYNTSLEDRIRARYTGENRATGEADKYLAQHSL